MKRNQKEESKEHFKCATHEIIAIKQEVVVEEIEIEMEDKKERKVQKEFKKDKIKDINA